MSSSKFELGFSEICCPYIHGCPPYTWYGFNINNNNNDVTSRFLVYSTYSPEEFYENDHIDLIEHIQTSYDERINNDATFTHPYIRNYREIAKKFIKMDIISLEVLETKETVCTIHTFWIKIIQRKWKKIYNERKKILKYGKNIRHLRERELMGKYKSKIIYPEFKLGIKRVLDE